MFSAQDEVMATDQSEARRSRSKSTSPRTTEEEEEEALIGSNIRRGIKKDITARLNKSPRNADTCTQAEKIIKDLQQRISNKGVVIKGDPTLDWCLKTLPRTADNQKFEDLESDTEEDTDEEFDETDEAAEDAVLKLANYSVDREEDDLDDYDETAGAEQFDEEMGDDAEHGEEDEANTTGGEFSDTAMRGVEAIDEEAEDVDEGCEDEDPGSESEASDEDFARRDPTPPIESETKGGNLWWDDGKIEWNEGEAKVLESDYFLSHKYAVRLAVAKENEPYLMDLFHQINVLNWLERKLYEKNMDPTAAVESTYKKFQKLMQKSEEKFGAAKLEEEEEEEESIPEMEGPESELHALTEYFENALSDEDPAFVTTSEVQDRIKLADGKIEAMETQIGTLKKIINMVKGKCGQSVGGGIKTD